MTDSSLVIVDTNVILDIVQQDARWLDWSLDALSRCESVCVNPIIYAELCYLQSSSAQVDELLKMLEIDFRELPREALYLASQAFRHYRKLGGAKSSPLADFFIGAHAAALGVPILTRDVKRYQSYFPSVTLICP